MTALVAPSARRPNIALALIFLVLPLLSACGYNTIPTAEENAKAAWSEVLNQYQRRADLIPNLVETVKGYAAHEKDVLEGVVEARAKATQVTVLARALSDPEAFKAVPGQPGRADQRAVAAAGGGGELSGPQGEPEFSGACRRSSKAPKTASPSRVATTSRPCATTI
jgi:hypothetical protein